MIDRIDGVIVRLGTYWNPLYVVVGREAAIIDGGVLPLYPLVAETVLSLSREVPISHWIVTHAHFDHCGLLPYLRDELPGCQICASASAGRILGRAKAAAFIEEQNHTLCRLNEMAVPEPPRSAQGFQIERCLDEGDEIDLGSGVRLLFNRSRGHSECGLSVWLPKQQVLFPSDALGACVDEEVFPLIFHSYREYAASLDQLEALRPRRIMPGHYQHHSGSEAQSLFYRAREGVEAFHRSLSGCARGEGVAEAVEKLADRYYQKLARGLLPREMFVKSLKAMWQIIEEGR